MASPDMGYTEGAPPPSHWDSPRWKHSPLSSPWGHQSLTWDGSMADSSIRDFHPRLGLILAQSSPALGRAQQPAANGF